MIYLLAVSLLWAFSFGLIKGELTGLDPFFTSFARLAIAVPLFLPFLRLKGIGRREGLVLAGIGAIQFGAMYVLYFLSFEALPAWQVALFTIFTPLYVVIVASLWDGKAPGLRVWLATLLAISGAGAIFFETGEGSVTWSGFLLVQGSNLCFAFGQVAYVRWKKKQGGRTDASVFALPYLGAVLVTALAATLSGGWATLGELTLRQGLVLGYLGLLATGLGFFWWNRGATRVTAGVLAVLNNLKIPLAVLVSLVVFGEEANFLRLAISGVLMAGALILVCRPRTSP